MICPSKLSRDQLAKLTDQEVARIYMDHTTRWKDDKGRYWLVFRRHEELIILDGKFDSRTIMVEFVNLATERRAEIPIEMVAQKLREGKLVRIEETLEIKLSH